eukprot:CAMPEP_0175074768 /NCGR_PEP_ID=MMETSP0052_2-20121109/21526_1 /TAXON_ID=51329 ORGANISM="Polytomella parva, Strain SAG 63-3" /NCGR_SAMPLE_ID=MMETSP0052_2 /ASSEMBLY_ACC=CAM_ASM_000194 /LENGTH=144 /DNA_ID=CAMNT_0016343175 /DNA_START=44 /DNA_END=475 /DNA_ORIENTATION=-
MDEAIRSVISESYPLPPYPSSASASAASTSPTPPYLPALTSASDLPGSIATSTDAPSPSALPTSHPTELPPSASTALPPPSPLPFPFPPTPRPSAAAAEEAAALLTRALEIQIRILGPVHPQVGDTCTTLAHLRRQQGRWVEAG